MKQLIGLDETATPNDAFSRITLGNKRYGINLYVKYEDGTPASGITITSSGSPPIDGSMVTDENGYLFLAQDSPDFTASIDNAGGKMYIDLEDNPSTQEVLVDTITDVTIVFSDLEGYRSVNTSNTFTMSNRVISFDSTTVGGGGGSGNATNTNATGGGGGGYVSTSLSTIVTDNKQIEITVGSGGKNDISGDGTTGGTTSVTYNRNIVTQSNGGGGSILNGAEGGVGNGNGGNASPFQAVSNPGGDGSGYIFNESSLGLAGGGGGGGGVGGSNTTLVSPGGKPFGGSGGSYWNGIAPQSGKGPGGGAGGNVKYPTTSKAGGQGVVYLRFHH